MTEIDLVGGVYRERVAFPHWNQFLGSGGRAALALTGLVETIRLHTAVADEERVLAGAAFETQGIDVRLSTRESPIEFDYLHCLAIPKIYRKRRTDAVLMPAVSGNVVVKFGMIEAEPVVRAKHVVYDPQSAFTPTLFSTTGSTAEHLAVIANRGEMLRMAKSDSIGDAVSAILASEGAEVVVVKDGIDGADVYVGGECHHVPAYKTLKVFSLGSGDVFVSAFAFAWAIKGMPPSAAADYASRSVADYVETRILPIKEPGSSEIQVREEVQRAGGSIYLAGPFRETGQRMLIDDARDHLRSLGMHVFSPIHDIGPGTADLVVHQDLAAVRRCDAVFAILNGSSPGTVFEVGYARALDKPVFCVAQNMRDVDIKLPKGSGAFIHDDYVSALFQIAWRT